jgi:glyoxylase-like metal-dependent hydrolase (beta-lactamase superfamily II)
MELREIGPDLFLLNVLVDLNVKSVNLYIFRGDVPTILDAGTNSLSVYEEIQEALRYLGIKQLEQALLTHWHVDHAGGAENLARKGARIMISHKEYEQWSGFARGEVLDLINHWAEFEWGVPREQVSRMLGFYEMLRRLTSFSDTAEIISDQQIIKAGNTNLKAIHTPGHSEGHLSFYEEKNRFLFSGDMLLPDQIPYPAMWLENGQAVSGLPSYMNSLDVLEKLSPRKYFPAHGTPQGDPVERCQEVRAQIYKQVERFIPQASVYEGAIQLSKGKINSGAMFLQLHYVYGWEKLKEQLAMNQLLKSSIR